MMQYTVQIFQNLKIISDQYQLRCKSKADRQKGPWHNNKIPPKELKIILEFETHIFLIKRWTDQVDNWKIFNRMDVGIKHGFEEDNSEPHVNEIKAEN